MTGPVAISGTIWRTPALSIERVDIPTQTSMKGHGHDSIHLCLLESGYFVERDCGRSQEVVEGTLRTSPAGDQHDLMFGESSRCLLIILHDELLSAGNEFSYGRKYWKLPAIERAAHKLLSSLPEQDTSIDLELSVLEFTASVSISSRKSRGAFLPSWLKRIRQRLIEAPANPPTTQELSKEAGLHPVYVARAFRQRFGIGIGEFTRRIRAKYACQLLIDTNEDLAQIAANAGYADQSHLTRSLQKFFSTTPLALRQSRTRSLKVSSVQ